MVSRENKWTCWQRKRSDPDGLHWKTLILLQEKKRDYVIDDRWILVTSEL